MPDTVSKYSGSPLKERLSTAARMTAQQQNERTQNRTRRQTETQGKHASVSARPRSKENAKPEKRKGSGSGRFRRVGIVIVCLVVLAVVVLYPVGRTYYQTLRTEQRLQAQLDAVNARNDAVAAENEALQTQEGIENQARENLGWIKEGEEGAIVTNEQGSTDNTSKLPERVDENNIKAPQTWYYSILDAIFFVQE